MKGLRTQETDKFNRFFAIIQEEAKNLGAIFFADAGDGGDFSTPTMEGENMVGWLIPADKAEAFEPMWRACTVDDSWSDFFMWAVWEKNGESIRIRFEE